MDWLDLAARPERLLAATCRVPRDLEEVTAIGEEVRPRELGVSRGGIDRIWDATRALYGTGLYPAVQICIRRRGQVVLHRALGHAAGNAPGDPPEAEAVPVTLDTTFAIFSASKAITAMLIHKRGELHLDDRLCEYIPELAAGNKQGITIRHLLTHRAGIPRLPPEVIDLDLLADPEQVLDLLCELRPVARPGQRLAYHAFTAGFGLGEVVRRVTGQDVRALLAKEVAEPLGLRWMSYGAAPEDVDRVARNALTGPPVLPPMSWLVRRALGAGMRELVALSNDPRFLAAPIPACNLVATAGELAAFYQCLLDEGTLDGVRVFQPRTVRHATLEQSHWEFDRTLGLPLRYGLGMMLGGRWASLFGPDTPEAFGHLGFTHIFTWADPRRELAAAILTSGKPLFPIETLRVYRLLTEIDRAFVRRR